MCLQHYIALHYIILHYITLHYITLHYITLYHIKLHYITLHYITLHYITSHNITLNYITLRLVLPSCNIFVNCSTSTVTYPMLLSSNLSPLSSSQSISINLKSLIFNRTVYLLKVLRLAQTRSTLINVHCHFYFILLYKHQILSIKLLKKLQIFVSKLSCWLVA